MKNYWMKQIVELLVKKFSLILSYKFILKYKYNSTKPMQKIKLKKCIYCMYDMFILKEKRLVKSMTAKS